MRDHELLRRVEVNPRVMLGKPVIRGTRIPVEQILRKLAQDIAHDEIIADFPQLIPQDIQAALAYTVRVLSTEEIVPLPVLEGCVPRGWKDAVYAES